MSQKEESHINKENKPTEKQIIDSKQIVADNQPLHLEPSKNEVPKDQTSNNTSNSGSNPQPNYQVNKEASQENTKKNKEVSTSTSSNLDPIRNQEMSLSDSASQEKAKQQQEVKSKIIPDQKTQVPDNSKSNIQKLKTEIQNNSAVNQEITQNINDNNIPNLNEKKKIETAQVLNKSLENKIESEVISNLNKKKDSPPDNIESVPSLEIKNNSNVILQKPNDNLRLEPKMETQPDQKNLKAGSVKVDDSIKSNLTTLDKGKEESSSVIPKDSKVTEEKIESNIISNPVQNYEKQNSESIIGLDETKNTGKSNTKSFLSNNPGSKLKPDEESISAPKEATNSIINPPLIINKAESSSNQNNLSDNQKSNITVNSEYIVKPQNEKKEETIQEKIQQIECQQPTQTKKQELEIKNTNTDNIASSTKSPEVNVNTYDDTNNNHIDEEEDDVVLPKNKFIDFGGKMINNQSQNFSKSEKDFHIVSKDEQKPIQTKMEKLKKDSKIQEILNTFPSKPNKVPFADKVKDIKEYSALPNKDEEIILPSNKKKNNFSEEKAAKIENDLNVKTQNSFNQNQRSDEGKADASAESIYARSSAALIQSLNETKNMIDELNNLGKPSTKYGGKFNDAKSAAKPNSIYSSNFIGNKYSDKGFQPPKTLHDTRLGNTVSPKKDADILAQTRAHILQQDKPNKKTNFKENSYFTDLYLNLKMNNKTLNVLNEKIGKISSKPIKLEAAPSEYQITDSNFSNIREEVNNEEENSSHKINEQLKNLRDNLTKESKPMTKEAVLAKFKNIPNLDLRDNESKKNYANVVKQNIDDFNEKKKDIDKQRGNYFASLDTKMDMISKKTDSKESTNQKDPSCLQPKPELSNEQNQEEVNNNNDH